MIHVLRIGLIIYLGGLALTAALVGFGSAIGGERPTWFGGQDGRFLAFWLMLWPVSLPIVLYLLATHRGPRKVDLDEESVDL